MVSGNSAGLTEYLVEGDTRAGEETNFISDRVVLNVTVEEAASFGLVAGEPEPKPEAAPV